MSRRVALRIEAWAAVAPFRIAGYEWDTFAGVVCEIEEAGCIGRGEAIGVYYNDEDEHTLLRQLEAFKPRIIAGISRADLQDALPAGGARNAVDAALWDLEAKCSGVSAWERAGVAPAPLQSLFTVGIAESPGVTAELARQSGLSLLKIKLDRQQPVETTTAVRAACPDATLVVDVNGAWTFEELSRYAPAMADLGVEVIEQPLARGNDAALEGYRSPVPLCADESCLHLGELDNIVNRYEILNIKLDKTGGLTHALQLLHAARQKGIGIMVGSMCGSSLSMAPLFVLGQLADYVDIDGPLLARSDHLDGLLFQHGHVSLPKLSFWGG